MRLVGPAKSILNIIICLCALAQSSPAQSKRIVIAASTILDGKGHVLSKTRIVVDCSQDPCHWCLSVANSLFKTFTCLVAVVFVM